MDLQHKNISLEIKVDKDDRTIEGYGAVFGNVDSWGDIIMPGAFIESIKDRLPKMLYQHRSDKPIGRWDAAREDSKGLYVSGKLAKTALAEEVYELASMGALDGMSIGYYTKEYENNEKGERLLKKVELLEVSVVTFPANEMALISGVKTAPETEREFELLLRDAGYSREAAKIITARGFKALSGQREAEANGLITSINNVVNILKG